MVSDGGTAQGLPPGLTPLVPLLLGVLLVDSAQLNPFPRMPFPRDNHLAQGHTLPGRKPQPVVGQCSRYRDPASLSQGGTTLMGQPSSRDPIESAKAFL